MSREMDDMGVPMSKREANKRYDSKTYIRIGFLTRKEERLGELITLGADKTCKSKSVYMKDAIQSQLLRDGITIDMLPENEPLVIPEEPKQPKRCMVYLVTELFIGEGGRMRQEKYVTTLQTAAMAKKYAEDRLSKKAHPEEWMFKIYGKEIEAKDKPEARIKLRQMAKDAQEKVEKYLIEDIEMVEDEDGDMMIAPDALYFIDGRIMSFTYMLWTDDFKPEYVEEVKHKKVGRKKKQL